MAAALVAVPAPAAPDDPCAAPGAGQPFAAPCPTDGIAQTHGLGTLSGTVTEAGTGVPLELITVFVTSAASGAWDGEGYDTAADGTYSVELPPGDYYVMFANEFGSHNSMFWDGAARWDETAAVTVTADQTTVVDTVLTPSTGSISGTITDMNGGPLEGIFAFAVHEHPDFDEESIPKASFGVAISDVDGSYTINGLPDGDYWVAFVSLFGIGWHDTTDYTGDPVADGTALVPVSGAVAGIDGMVDTSAIVLGDVIDSYTGDPIAGICVDVVDALDDATVIKSTVTDDAGDFLLGGLTGVAFKIRFTDCTRDVYVETWNGSLNPADPSDATVYLMDDGDLSFVFATIDLRLTDIDGSIFRDDIIWLAGEGITTGCNAEKTLFCPGDSVTRGQMAAFLVRALDLTDLDPSIDFDDDDNSIFETDIEKLATAAITSGCGANDFCPEGFVTRAQMAAFLVRALDLTDLDPSIDFPDDDNSVFEIDIEKLATAGITSGCGNGDFCPADPVTRGQMAAFLKRALAE